MDFKEFIKKPEYDFLRTNPHLGEKIILLGVGGSISYGTNMPDSDIDIRGIAVNSKSELLGLDNFEQYVETNTDTTIYSLRKIISLLLNCNPNTIEMFGLRNDHYIYINDIGKKLLDNSNLFLSQKAIQSFGGYSNQQCMRLKNNIARYSLAQSEKELHIFRSIKNAMCDFHSRYRDFSDGEITLYIDKSDQDDMESEIFMDINLEHYPLRDYKSIWSEMNNIVKDYTKIGKRNKKKDENHMAKHMMHLLRLYMMCYDILINQQIITYREDEHDLLMSVRNGEYLVDGKVKDEFWKLLDEQEKRFQYAKEHTKLPKTPDYDKVNKLLIELNEMALEVA